MPESLEILSFTLRNELATVLEAGLSPLPYGGYSMYIGLAGGIWDRTSIVHLPRNWSVCWKWLYFC